MFVVKDKKVPKVLYFSCESDLSSLICNSWASRKLNELQVYGQKISQPPDLLVSLLYF